MFPRPFGRLYRISNLACASLALALVASACGGAAQQDEYREAAVAAGIAGAAQIVKSARAQAPDANGGATFPGGCCAVCRPCEFPCGDRCVPYGTVCVEPSGCACTSADSLGRDQPVDESVPPGGCPTEPGVIVPAP